MPKLKPIKNKRVGKGAKCEGHKIAISEAQKAYWEDPEHREMRSKRISEAKKKQYQDPAFRAKMYKATCTEEIRKKRSEANKKRHKESDTHKTCEHMRSFKKRKEAKPLKKRVYPEGTGVFVEGY